MNDKVESLLVPASLIRIRAFLGRAGLRVPPWADSATVLEAFHGVLRGAQGDPAFWKELGALLEALGSDLDARKNAGARAVPNELLDAETRGELLTEIQRAVEEHTPSPEGERRFPRLARSLSAPAFAALCLIAGAAVAGCGGRASTDPNASGGTGTHSGGTGGTHSGGTGGSDAGGAFNGTGGASTGGSNSGGNSPIETGGAGGTAGAGPCVDDRTLEAIISECAPASSQSALLECVATLNDSWVTGLQGLLSCTTCDDARMTLQCLLQACGDPNLSQQYSLDALLEHCIVPLYIGVRID